MNRYGFFASYLEFIELLSNFKQIEPRILNLISLLTLLSLPRDVQPRFQCSSFARFSQLCPFFFLHFVRIFIFGKVGTLMPAICCKISLDDC
jgi:hypothetical protein